MEDLINFKNNCPDIFIYEKVLGSTASNHLQMDFYRHLDECELCKMAFEGYRVAGINQISDHMNKLAQQPKVVEISHSNRLLAYAATIALLISSFFMFQYYAPNNQSEAFSLMEDYSGDITPSSNATKKMMAKNTEDYWYIGSNGEIRLNDQAIAPDQINLLQLEQGKKAFVEVGINDTKVSNGLIDRLKEDKKQIVFAFAKERVLNKL